MTRIQKRAAGLAGLCVLASGLVAEAVMHILLAMRGDPLTPMQVSATVFGLIVGAALFYAGHCAMMQTPRA